MAEVKQTAQAGLTWEEVCADPHLEDLPYKIETNEWGQIVMSPTRLRHGDFQYRIARFLDDALPEGRVITEAAIKTGKGTKVADVAWFSAERWVQVRDEFDASVAPELCVEIISPTNAAGEIEQKRRLYFNAGAREVWLCDLTGRLRVYTTEGEVKASAMVPGAPMRIDIG